MLVPPTQSTRQFEGAATGSVRKQNRQPRRQALLRAATELFAAQGFDRTTTRQIAARAGCAEGLIHRYFKGKAGLLQASLEAETGNALAQRSDGFPPPGDLEEALTRLLESEVEALWRHREFLLVAVPQTMLDPGAGKHLHRVLGPDRRKEEILPRLRELQQNGLLGAQEPESLAETVVTLGLGLVVTRQLIFGCGPGEIKRLALAMARILCAGQQTSARITPPIVPAGNENSDAY